MKVNEIQLNLNMTKNLFGQRNPQKLGRKEKEKEIKETMQSCQFPKKGCIKNFVLIFFLLSSMFSCLFPNSLTLLTEMKVFS